MTDARPSEVHVTIDRLVVRGLSTAQTHVLVGELRAGLAAAFGDGPPPVAPHGQPGPTRRARELGRRAAEQIAQAGDR